MIYIKLLNFSKFIYKIMNFSKFNNYCKYR